MPIIDQIASTLQDLFGRTADQLARDTRFVQRSSKCSGALFAQTLVFAYLSNPDATLDELSQQARALGLTISAQGIDDRFSPFSAAFLHCLLADAVKRVLAADPIALPLLDRFAGVLLEDSTVMLLPDALRTLWAGCGSATGDAAAALKVNLRLNLSTGQLDGLSLHHGRVHDRCAAEPLDTLPGGSLLVTDLGYFSLERLKQVDARGAFFLSRMQGQTLVFDREGRRWDDLRVLLEQQGDEVDLPVELGASARIKARLLAVRVPQEVADQRRRRLRAEAQRRKQAVSKRALALAAWTILVTNVPVEQLTVKEALVLAWARWQIELVFKRWKSQGQIDTSRSEKEWRVMTDMYAKLLAMVVQQWVGLTSLWQYVDKSLAKAVKVVQKYAMVLARALRSRHELVEALDDLAYCLERNCHLNRRKKHPNTYQLLIDVTQGALA